MAGSGSGTALAAYADGAGGYDARTAAFAHYRRLGVAELPLAPGDTVIDVGCGTGLCFDMIESQIGRDGTLVAVDPSPEMIGLAAQRVDAHGWSNVVLVTAPAEAADLPDDADHALFCATHDVLQSDPALDNVVGHLRGGATVAAVGGKWGPPWAAALNAGVMALHAPFVRDFAGFDRPWAHLAGHLERLTVREVALGAGYVASGATRPS
jgi:SAM-dependent methyltransferase